MQIQRLSYVTLTFTAFLAACGSQNAPEPERFGEGVATARPDRPPVALSLTGCVQRTPGDQFVLDKIGFESEREQERLGRSVEDYELTGAEYGITEGAWVRLAPRGHDLNTYLGGERVWVSGTVVASGANTIGTAGSAGYELPSGERSMAARPEMDSDEKVQAEAGRIARQSLANGTAAEMAVHAIRRTGDPCLASEADATP